MAAADPNPTDASAVDQNAAAPLFEIEDLHVAPAAQPEPRSCAGST